MTFSDSRVVSFINENFVPVWESASAARWVKFDLGEGRNVKGIATGEIALYFCDSSGHVFDVLPALQSPAQTLAAMKEAAEFFTVNKGELSEERVKSFHRKRMGEIGDLNLTEAKLEQFLKRESSEQNAQGESDAASLTLQKSESGMKARENRISEAIDEATEDLRHLAFSKAFVSLPVGTPLLVVEPGGKDYYRWEVGRRFLSLGTWGSEAHLFPTSTETPSSERTPDEWKVELFEHVLMQPLDRGGEVTYDSSSLEAIRIIPE